MTTDQLSPKAEQAVRWLIATPRDRSIPTIVQLRERFGLTPLEACLALREERLRIVRAI
jgi:hypothetical protein